MKPPSLSVLLLGVILAAGSCASAQEWTRFRGPNGSGIGAAKTVPTKISDADVRWRIDLPGTGHSSPVLWGDHVFVTTTGDKAGGLSVHCISANEGRMLWTHDFALAPFPRHAFNSFASSTPTVDAERVYVAWNEAGHFILTALDHGGKVAWQRDFGPFISQHGCGISPIIEGNKIILGNDQDDTKFVKEHPRSGASFIVAVDSGTGKTVWQTARQSAVVSYATPCVYEADGKRSLIFTSQGHGFSALDPDSGVVLWEYAKAFDKRTVSSPILAGDLIIGSCGSGGGGHYVTAIKPGDKKSGRAPELVYQLKKSAPYVPTGVVHGNLAWFWNDNGILSCVEAATGNIRYQERVGGDYFGSPVWIDGRLFCVSTTGEIVVGEASDRFKLLHRYPLGETCHSTPAVALGRLFVRTERHLYCIGGSGQPVIR